MTCAQILAGPRPRRSIQMLGGNVRITRDRSASELAGSNNMPSPFVEQSELLVDTHVHTHYSDGIAGVPRIERFCRDRGMGVAVTDHNEIRGCDEHVRARASSGRPGHRSRHRRRRRSARVLSHGGGAGGVLHRRRRAVLAHAIHGAIVDSIERLPARPGKWTATFRSPIRSHWGESRWTTSTAGAANRLSKRSWTASTRSSCTTAACTARRISRPRYTPRRPASGSPSAAIRTGSAPSAPAARIYTTGEANLGRALRLT